MATKDARLDALNRQIVRLERRIDRLNQDSNRISWIRLAIAVSWLLAGGIGLYLAGVWVLGFVVAAEVLLFGAAVRSHRQINESLERHRVWLQIKSAHVARMRLDWEHIPATFGHRPRSDHPYESDLDLVGRRTLHHLLDTAVSYEGSKRLRSWLTMSMPNPEETLERQRLVRELVPLRLFRDKLILHATLAAGAGKTWNADQLVKWLREHAPTTSVRLWLLVFSGLASVNATLFCLNWVGLLPPIWQLTAVVYLGFLLGRSNATKSAFEEALALQDALRQLLQVLRHFERFPYHNTPHLRALCAPFLDAGNRPSKYLARTTRVLAAMGVRANPFIWFTLNAVLPWDSFVAHRLNQFKKDLAQRAPEWLDVWFQIEALNALANFAYLNPHYSFPDILTDVGQEAPYVFRTQGLGHPLIRDDEKVRNDVQIPKFGWVAIITGSNMAGKTVFLKTVGMNLALTNAGGPVDAQFMQTVPFRLFSSIKVSDSVTDGISYFYAEVQRLKSLVLELERECPLPLSFLIDEVFRGTNNRERLIGSRSLVARLAGARGVGLIATHDLELAKLAEQLPTVTNYHFRDHVVDGRMAFDYVLRPGPSPTTNALKIMKAEGLISGPG